jgi:molybdopterin-containing oxidoreductase family membrane subunit
MTVRHIENMNKVILLTGTLGGYAYSTEFFIAWYSGSPYEGFAFVNRAFGPFAWAYWIMISCNVITPQFFWFKKIRTSMMWTFVMSIFVNIGMWFERFVIVVTLHRDYTPSAWDYYVPTIFDISTFIGSFGLFFTLFILFLKYLPAIAIAEIKGVMPQADPHWEGYHKHEEAPHG